MEIFFNHISVLEPAKSLEAARTSLLNFLYLCRDLLKSGKPVFMIDSSAYEHTNFTLHGNYTIFDWKKDADVDRDARSLYMRIVDKSKTQEISFDIFDKKDETPWVYIYCNEYSIPLISILFGDKYAVDDIELEYEKLAENDGEPAIISIESKICNFHEKNSVKAFNFYFEKKKSHVLESKTGKEFIENIEYYKLCPNIVFLEEAKNQIKNIENSKTREHILGRIIMLQQCYCTGIYIDSEVLRMRPESKQTLSKSPECRTFRLPSGKEHLFSYHINYSTDSTGRIYFEHFQDEMLTYIAYIGNHLRTVLYKA